MSKKLGPREKSFSVPIRLQLCLSHMTGLPQEFARTLGACATSGVSLNCPPSSVDTNQIITPNFRIR